MRGFGYVCRRVLQPGWARMAFFLGVLPETVLPCLNAMPVLADVEPTPEFAFADDFDGVRDARHRY
jgi:hypothetical protein